MRNNLDKSYERDIEMLVIKRFSDLNKKKQEGFTLIEVISVVAIIGMLAVILLPKIGGQIKEAKKLKVVENCRQVVMAVEAYNLKLNGDIKQNDTVETIMKKKGISNYVEAADLKNIDLSQTKLKDCYEIVEGAEFDFKDGSEILNPSTIINNDDKK